MIRNTLLFIVLLNGIQFVFSQEETDSVIAVRHRFFQFKHDDGRDNIEQVDSFRTLHLVIAGNIYQTEQHVAYAFDKQKGTYDFRNELKYVQPILGLGDITIANLKTSFGNDVKNMFSSPDEFALALKYAGINTLMHANALTVNIDKATFKKIGRASCRERV